jgi:hypothetical protein
MWSADIISTAAVFIQQQQRWRRASRHYSFIHSFPQPFPCLINEEALIGQEENISFLPLLTLCDIPVIAFLSAIIELTTYFDNDDFVVVIGHILWGFYIIGLKAQ